jgi:hypothetical protein
MTTNDVLICFLIGSNLAVLATLFKVIQNQAPSGDNIKGQLAEVNRRFALVMSKLDIKDEATAALEEFLKIRLTEAREAIGEIDTLVAERKDALVGDLKKIEEKLLGKKTP